MAVFSLSSWQQYFLVKQQPSRDSKLKLSTLIGAESTFGFIANIFLSLNAR